MSPHLLRIGQVCSAIDQPADSIRACHTERPYCVNNACTAQPDQTNPQCFNTPDASNSITCTGAGQFPDPFNCGLYYECSAAAPAGVPMQWRCPVGSAYDSRLQQCRTTQARTAAASRALEARMCTTAMCPKRFVGMVPYAPNPQLYVFCFEQQRMVFRCRDERSQVFDARRGECVYECRAGEGHFVDREDCRRFYTCTRKGAKFVAQRNACPAGWAFAAASGRCEREAPGRACVAELA